MNPRNGLILLLGLVGVVVMGGLGVAEETSTNQEAKLEMHAEWVGEWGPYNPAKEMALKKEDCKTLECHVQLKDGKWHATFEGECSRPYKYSITMEGSQVGECVMFKGTSDLGEEDGGVFDWIGRAVGDEFVGFFTNENYTGVFHMAPAKVTNQDEASE